MALETGDMSEVFVYMNIRNFWKIANKKMAAPFGTAICYNFASELDSESSFYFTNIVQSFPAEETKALFTF